MKSQMFVETLRAAARPQAACAAAFLALMMTLSGCASTESVDESNAGASDDAPPSLGTAADSDGASAPAREPGGTSEGSETMNASEMSDPADEVASDAGPPTADLTAKALRARAERYWTAKQEQDWGTLFRFEAFHDQPEASLAEYEAWKNENEPLVTESYEIDRVLLDGTMGWLEVTSEERFRKLPAAAPQQTTRWQKWWHDGDDWMPVPSTAQDAFPESPALRDAERERELREVAIESWEARQNERWDVWYDHIEPRDAEQIPRDEFIEAADKLRFLSYEIKWVQVIGEHGRVRVEFMFKPNDPSLTKMPPQPKAITETWVPIDGVWYQDVGQN